MAAGLGFKTFTTGEVLTAADVNGYLMQGILVFANATARDAAITSPQEGQCCYLKDTDAVLTYSGSAWVGFDDSNAIQNSIINAKGDLISGSANDTPAILSVGSNGETLVADSSATTGLRWTATPSASNPVINSAMQIAQRGTSVSLAANTQAFTLDRWLTATGTSQACTVSRQATGDTTNLPSIQYCMRYQRNSGQTGAGGQSTYQNIETVNSVPYSGKTVTVSVYARKGADYSASGSVLNLALVNGTGTDQSIFSGFTGQNTVVYGSMTLTATWQRFSFTATVPTNSTQLAIGVAWQFLGTAGTNDYFEVTGFQIDVGNTALPFRTCGGTLAGELLAAQRYYFKHGASGANSPINTGSYYTASNVGTIVTFPVPMRVAPTFSATSGTDYYMAVRNGGLDGFNSFTQDSSNTSASILYNNTEAAGTAGHAALLITNNASASIAWSAEL